MWCDNCLLLFPLRGGAIAWNIVILLYSLLGSIYFLFVNGQYLFFNYPEWQIYGGIGMAVASLSLLTILALSNRSYMLSRFTLFLWPLILLLSAIRAGVMLFQLNRQQSKITWECANGRQLWPESAKQDWAKEDSTMPGVLCILNFHSLYILFAFGLVIDLVMQMYATFMIWRFKSAIEHAYRQVRDDKGPGYY